MALILRENPYKGVNAHLQSDYQAAGGWAGFHSTHIIDLSRHIDENLPDGYTVEPEQALQIREYHPDTGERIRRPQPDITVSASKPGITQGLSTGTIAPTLTQPVAQTDTLGRPEYLAAVVVSNEEEGYPILRIEVLFATNKRGGSGDIQYAEKRRAALRSGVQLIEVDYLHESHAIIRGLPVYPDQANAFPYHITVSNPVPSYEEGVSATYGFAVDQPIPKITVPLLRDDTLPIDFNAVYHQSFSSLKAIYSRADYTHPPANFDRYAPADQDRIRAVMARVQREHEDT